MPQRLRPSIQGGFLIEAMLGRVRVGCVSRGIAICGLLGLFLAVGCKKEDASSAGKPRSSNPSVAAETSSADTTATIVIPDSGNPDANLNALSMELRRYVLRTMTAPRSFDEFVANAHVQAPPAPADKKYSIKEGAVVLVKR